ncbi:MAG: NusG domain II-containing protein [Defluviitaleaceae bacterium]|nr:NusG domain II-containing protein [Defluviitaleaceae bacterium]
MQILRKADLVLIAFFILLAILLAFIFVTMGTRYSAFVAVSVDGIETFVIDIGQNEGESFEIISQNGVNEILVKDRTVRMISANCPDGYCVRMGAISNRFQVITCLPNRVIVEIRGGDAVAVDVVAR